MLVTRHKRDELLILADKCDVLAEDFRRISKIIAQNSPEEDGAIVERLLKLVREDEAPQSHGFYCKSQQMILSIYRKAGAKSWPPARQTD